MNKTKKILSLLLAVLMLLSISPMAYAESDTYQVGDIIQFGSYPQSEVTDETIIAELNALAPEWEDWTSYGYYSGLNSLGTATPSDWMRYTDLTLKDERYRGVMIIKNRPFYTSSSHDHNHQEDNDYYPGVYWFKFEKINWRVLDPVTGLVMCETIIDSQPYSNTLYYDEKNSETSQIYRYYNDFSFTNYASDYETSSIRYWLNNNFYNIAFTNEEKENINTTTLNNNCFSPSLGIGDELLNSNPTYDKIFLLSHEEITNTSFGFDPSLSVNNRARRANGSDYAKSQGLLVNSETNTSTWILRTAGSSSEACRDVRDAGSSYPIARVDYTFYGIRPAMHINFNSTTGQNIYNLGEETYSFDNYVDEDSDGGHCFGMSVTSSGYYVGSLDKSIIGGNDETALYSFGETDAVKEPICHYHAIQGPGAEQDSMVAGGSIDLTGIIDTVSDWNECIDYVENHRFDNSGSLQIGMWYEGSGGHAVNFLYFDNVNGQDRIYAYDNNFPDIETYYYLGTDGLIYQAPVQTSSRGIIGFDLMDVQNFFSLADEFELNRHIYSNRNAISIDKATAYNMKGASELGTSVMFKILNETSTVTITPLVDNATFTYMGKEYSFGEIDEDTYAEFTLSTSEEDTPEFEIVNAPEVEPDTPSDPTENCSCNCHAGGVKTFFFKLFNFFQKLFGKNKVCACGVKH